MPVCQNAHCQPPRIGRDEEHHGHRDDHGQQPQQQCPPGDDHGPSVIARPVKNTARKNSEDGFDINATDVDTVTMTGNRAIRNANTGIENDGGADTTLKDNIMKGNGIDLAGKGDEDTPGDTTCTDSPGAATDGGGNVFSTGGFSTCVPDGSDD